MSQGKIINIFGSLVAASRMQEANIQDVSWSGDLAPIGEIEKTRRQTISDLKEITYYIKMRLEEVEWERLVQMMKVK